MLDRGDSSLECLLEETAVLQSALGRLTYGCQPLYLDLNILKWEILQVKNVYNFKYRLRKLRLND
jgi:hypothetical protein